MRLLSIDKLGKLRITENIMAEDIPRYAILSHTWGPDDTELTFDDLKTGLGSDKPGHEKIRFCGQQAQKDNLEYFWVDTCCINKADYTELAEAITSMFAWYRDATKCYVYLSDVSIQGRACDQAITSWKSSFRESRWFTRGWTLQELLAPKAVDFFSNECEWLGDRTTLEQEIQEVTGIPLGVLRGESISSFSVEERMRWAAKRNTKRQEDKAYCLMGIFNVFMPLIYGEKDNAFNRLNEEINRSSSSKSLAITYPFARRMLFLDTYPQADSSHLKEKLLKSLNHGSPFTRLNKIPQCSEGTFEWILDDESSDKLSAPEGQLCQWLQHGNGVFWIKGKPGSGKSTIMRFLAGLHNQNPRTMRFLQTWAQPKIPRIYSFYFWLEDGSGTQNSFHGFLCCLLYQILSDQSPDFISSLPAVARYSRHQTIADWDTEELETLLKDVAHRVAEQTPLCFFVDALDECVAIDVDRIVQVIVAFALKSGLRIKFCVSSRPEQKLHNRIGILASQSLELDKLTREDIRRYVDNEFRKPWIDGGSLTMEQKEDLVHELVASAQGVFLWAFLVTRKLCEGMELGDSIDQLQKHLRELPQDMMTLYERMLKKAGDTNGERKAEAASYFQFAINHGGRIFRHESRGLSSRCRQNDLERLVPLYERYHGETLVDSLPDITERVRQRLVSLSAGLLMADDNGVYGPFVEFFHRTASDFFRESYGREILKQSGLSQLESYCLLVDAFARNRHRGCPGDLSARDVCDMIKWLDEAEGLSDADKLQFLHHVERTMLKVYSTTMGHSRSKNWVYEQAKFYDGDDQVLDFATLVLHAGWFQLISSHNSDTNQSLSKRYKDYLLLSSLKPYFSSPAWGLKFLQLGANPNARFYWGLQDRLKTSPWLQYLFYDTHHYDLDIPLVNAFLDLGADLDDRTLLLQRLAIDTLGSVELRCVPPRITNEFSYGEILVIEVNAKYLLERHCCSATSSIEMAEILSRPDVRQTPSHQKVLLVHPGYTSSFFDRGVHLFPPRQFGKVDGDDSTSLLDGLQLVLHMSSTYISTKISAHKQRKIREIWKRSQKVDIKQYLETKGYYKNANDPAVLQGPIPMFKSP